MVFDLNKLCIFYFFPFETVKLSQNLRDQLLQIYRDILFFFLTETEFLLLIVVEKKKQTNECQIPNFNSKRVY